MKKVKINPANWMCSRCGRHPANRVGHNVKCACGWSGLWLLSGGPEGRAADREIARWKKRAETW